MKNNKGAFTLIELLIVVLIIGVLTSIALPMYQGAVDKSHWSTMLPGAKAIKNAEEAIRMSNGLYTSNIENLDVAMPSSDVQYTIETINDDGTANVVHAINNKMPTVRLASYLDENTIRAGHLYCESNDGENGRGTRLCSKLLNGEELSTTEDGYTQYLLDQAVDKATCEGVSRIWSNKQTHCYKTTEERCTANGMPYKDGLCGYKNQRGSEENPLIIGEGAICMGNSWQSCNYVEVEDGGICIGNDTGCQHSEFKTGSQCIGNHSYSCDEGSVFSGARCEGNGQMTCHGQFSNGTICKGNGNGACVGDFSSGSKCIGDYPNSCLGTFNNSTCEGNVGSSCYKATFKEGGICIANTSATTSLYPCFGATFKSGSKCIANAPGTCSKGDNWQSQVIYDGGCCEGAYCPDNVPKC